MAHIGFDNDAYLKRQSQHIRERFAQFDKLYLEFGGKLFDDFHASRVLPGFQPDSKEPNLADYRKFLQNEVRYTGLMRQFPERAEELFAKAEVAAKEKYELMKRRAEYGC